MPRHVRIRLLVMAAIAVIAGAVWLAGDRQRAASDHAFEDLDAAQAVLVAMLDQEDGLYGYLDTGRQDMLERYENARQQLEHAFAEAEEDAEAEELADLAEQREVTARWQRLADDQLVRARAEPNAAMPESAAASLDRVGQRFRKLNREFRGELEEERTLLQQRAVTLTVGLILLLSCLFGGLGYLFFDRRARRDGRRRERHAQFTDVLQLARTEPEAYGLVKRYLERTVPGSCATVLNRNNSANRLEPSTPVDGTPLEETLDGADPESCLAVRGGKTHERRGELEPLLSCDVCGATAENTTCIPSLVGGEVIGSVLIEHPKPLRNGDADHLAASISEASPILANLRNLAIAEHRAATDALTGLPNSRAIQENMKRMAAHAGRTLSPFSAVLFDLDHFKRINDTFGHGKGDEVLAAVGAAVQDTVRASDIVGRYGGEEFVALLPDTDRDGAVLVAEKLRVAVEELQVPGVERRITASFGVSVIPDEARDPDELLRMADRALYLAKATGRNRVETLPDESEPVEA